jgi:two-component system LytT family sensor kinase
MVDVSFVINTLGFATGTVLFLLLLVLSWRADRLTGGIRSAQSGAWACAAALLWNAGSLVKHMALLMGVAPASMTCRLASAFAWTATAVLPTTFLFLLQPVRWSRSWQPRANRWLRLVSYVSALGLTIGLFMATLVSDFPLRFFTITKLSAYNLALHVVAMIIVFRGADQPTPAARTHSRTMAVLGIGLAASLLILIHLSLNPSVEMILGTLAQQVSIPAAIAAFARLAQFRFADVFVKRSLTILTAVVVASIYASLIVAPILLHIIGAHTPYPDAATWTIATILWAALLMLFPTLERVVNRAADRWLFRRPDYRHLAQNFAQESDPIGNEPDLFALAERHIQTALCVDAARVVPRAEAQPAGIETGPAAGGVIQLPPDHPARKQFGEPEVEVFVPIQVNGTVVYFLAIAPGECGRKLLNDELTFLSVLAERIGRKIESLQFERERRERQLREARLQHLLTEAELKALRAQVNPHFLFNTLNTIVDLISSEPEKAEAMTERLAEVFRYVLARTDSALIPVSEEFEFLRTYLDIEQARFGDRLRVELAVDPAIVAEPIPSLILQPLVENAIKHGVAPKLGDGTVRIRASDEGEFMRFEVEDDGVGWRDARVAWSPSASSEVTRMHHPPRQGGVGLRNITERLRTLYGDRAMITVRSEPHQGTCVSILIPKDETQPAIPGRNGRSQ